MTAQEVVYSCTHLDRNVRIVNVLILLTKRSLHSSRVILFARLRVCNMVGDSYLGAVITGHVFFVATYVPGSHISITPKIIPL